MLKCCKRFIRQFCSCFIEQIGLTCMLLVLFVLFTSSSLVYYVSVSVCCCVYACVMWFVSAYLQVYMCARVIGDLAAPIIMRQPLSQIVLRSHNLSLECEAAVSVTSDSPVDVQWRKDGQVRH